MIVFNICVPCLVSITLVLIFGGMFKLLCCWFLLSVTCVFAPAQTSFHTQWNQLLADSTMKNADISLCVLHPTGQPIFTYQSNKLLAPASTLKTLTTASALEEFGDTMRFRTQINLAGYQQGDTFLGQLIVVGKGDPSLGSDRFASTAANDIILQIKQALQAKHIKHLLGGIVLQQQVYADSARNTYWLAEDFGNYYGAGIFPLNWKENKFAVSISYDKGFSVVLNDAGLDNKRDFCLQLQAQKAGSYTDAYAYFNQGVCKYEIKGALDTLQPVHILSLASFDPWQDFVRDITKGLLPEITITPIPYTLPAAPLPLLTIVSPTTAELVYACNQKSLNLYAETFCKQLGLAASGKGTWPTGIQAIQKTANELIGKNAAEMSLVDGSGLSPENKISTAMLAELLHAYNSKTWFPVFFKSLPLIHNITMKSGYIGGTRSYAGYVKLRNQTVCSFAFIIHGYSGSPRPVKEKMFTILDALQSSSPDELRH